MPPPSSVDAATGPETVQVAASANRIDSADLCHTHSKDFMDCLNSHEIKLGKCMHHLVLLYQCRRRADDDLMKPSKVQEEEEEATVPANATTAVLLGNNAGSCYIPYQAFKDCVNKEDLNNDEVKLRRCEVYLHWLFVCHTTTGELFS